MNIAVYVPVEGRLATIDPGSGIVGTAAAGDRILIDFEGNGSGATSMRMFADRVHHAAGRHTERYPTIARRLTDADSVVLVGWFDPDTGVVTPDGPEGPDVALAAIAAWCSVPTADVTGQLATQGSARHQMQREVTAALASGDPARQFAARQMARRYHLDS